MTDKKYIEALVEEKVRRIEIKSMMKAMDQARKQYNENEVSRIYADLMSRVKDD